MIIGIRTLSIYIVVIMLIIFAILLITFCSYIGSLEGSRYPSDKLEIIQVGNKRLYVRYELKVPFSILERGRLVLCVEEGWAGALPCEPLRLFLVLPSKVIEIDDLNKLCGRVKIETPRDALAFVRLKTSPRTYHILSFASKGYIEAEIVSRDQIDTNFVFGDKIAVETLKKYRGYLGIVNKEKLAQLGIKPPFCSKVKHGYEIQRMLLVKDFMTNKQQILRVVEFVGRDGRYIRKESYPLGSPKFRAYP